MRVPKVAWVIGFVIAVEIVAASPVRGDSTSAAQVEGLRLYRAGNFAEAIPYFDQVLAKHHNNVEILNIRGICYLRTEQPEKALADFDRINRRSRAGREPLGRVRRPLVRRELTAIAASPS